MSIMWKYLDKRSATIAAITDYDSMQFIINSTDDEIKRTYEKMTSVASPKWDCMPRTHNPNAAEERILNGIAEIDILKERYRQNWRWCHVGKGPVQGGSVRCVHGPEDRKGHRAFRICRSM